MLNFFKNLFGSKKETAVEAPYKVEAPVVVEGIPAQVVVEGAGIVEAPAVALPIDEPAAKPAKAKKPRAPKDPSAPKKPRAKKAK